VSCLDVFDIGARRQDTVYLDPPYTKRQYAAYYHVLETIAEGDSPQVGGVTGLRPWGHKASPFCYKARALGALVSLVAKLEAERVLISYSDDGHISLDDLRPRLSELGALREHHLASVGRYRPNERASANGSSVAEHLLDLRRRQVGGSSRSRTRTAVTA
jgi:adenine-specific DNA-methyltransferase